MSNQNLWLSNLWIFPQDHWAHLDGLHQHLEPKQTEFDGMRHAGPAEQSKFAGIERNADAQPDDGHQLSSGQLQWEEEGNGD